MLEQLVREWRLWRCRGLREAIARTHRWSLSHDIDENDRLFAIQKKARLEFALRSIEKKLEAGQ